MIVGVCGLGYTGSGAVHDLLREYSCCLIEDEEEMAFAYRPDGLEDLQYHICSPVRFMSSDVAIQRFRQYMISNYKKRDGRSDEQINNAYKTIDKFIEEITQVKWQGFWGFDAANESTSWMKSMIWRLKLHNWWRKRKKNIFCDDRPCRDMRLSILSKQDFEIKAKSFTSDFLTALGYSGKEYVVLDQAFSGDDPTRSFPYFYDPKAIVIDKDPRDLYLLCKYEIPDRTPWIPTHRVQDFIEYYRLIRNDYRNILYKNNVLLLKFEELIYEYDSSTRKIEEFLGIPSSSHTEKYKHFDPKVSIYNTQLFRKYPQDIDDIILIEAELSQYIFDYKKYAALESFGKSF